MLGFNKSHDFDNNETVRPPRRKVCMNGGQCVYVRVVVGWLELVVI